MSQFIKGVIPDEFSRKIQSGIQKWSKLRNIFTTWIPAFAGMTNYDTASAADSPRRTPEPYTWIKNGYWKLKVNFHRGGFIKKLLEITRVFPSQLTFGAIIFLGVLSLWLTSCVNPPHIYIRHSFIDSPEKEYQLHALNSVYLLIEKPESIGTIDFAELSLEDLYSMMNVGKLAAALSAQLKKLDGGVLAYRVVKSLSEKDPFLDEIKPTSILKLKINKPSFSQKKEKEKRTTFKGEEYEVDVTISRCELDGHLILTSYPDNRELVNKVLAASSEKRVESSDWEKNSKNFFAQMSRFLESMPHQANSDYLDLLDSAQYDLVRTITNEINPARIESHYRPVYVEKENEESKKAYTLLKEKDKTEEAEAIWNKRIEISTCSWKDKWNLAVAAESRRDYDLARSRYEAIKEEAISQDKSLVGKFDEVFSDLKSSFLGREKPLASSAPWFDDVVAVLPLSDEVVSLDGPDIVRQNIYHALTQGGYKTIPLNEIDEKLRLKGFSDAGQFGATTKDNLAKWLGADRLVMGHITEYDEVNIGIYQSRSVAGNILIWNKSDKKEIWTSEKKVKNQKIPKDGSKILSNFLSGLGFALLERLGNAPLSAEAGEFARQSLEGLPFKP